MRRAFRAELDTLVSELAGITRYAGQVMTHASNALQQADVKFAELALSSGDEIRVLCEQVHQRCLKLLALQAPVATDLRTVLTAMRALPDLERMGHLAGHIAKITRLNHPEVPIPGEIRPIFARMSTLAITLAHDAAAAIETRDRFSGERLARVDEEIDALRRRIFRILFSPDWPHGVKPAVNAALIGRYYERFADHAVAIAHQISFLIAGRSPTRTKTEN
ncbi:MAG TPA: phosphate signaling complex protein PhoU [Pseudonocardiaceae bacterium]|nr:phosphate signaling complex protein PhoU [Pseudonocardiaceae bacterium]